MPSSSYIRPFKDSGEHSFHRRAYNHDYFAPFIYHIILKKERNCEKFGDVVGDAKIPFGNEGCAGINESPLGKIIAKEIIHLKYQFPILKLHQFVVMPDHVHILLQVLFRSDKHLEYYIDNLRANIHKKYSRLLGQPIEDTHIFEAGFCDKPLYDDRSLDGWYVYIRENPHRLAMRFQYPKFFERVRNLKIGEKEYEAYGNLFLFRNPDKVAVKMSSKFSEETRKKKITFYNDACCAGSVLVSPFIHEDEKLIRDSAEKSGGKFILIQSKPFPEKFKPGRHNFNLCTQGKLLIIAPKEPYSDSFRETCLEMNKLAEEIAKFH